jgi:anti-sigma factor RsiW
MSCPEPIDPEVLADYWAGLLPEQEEPAVEEHLLSCDDCSVRLREMVALIDGIRRLADAGSLRMVVTDAFVRRLAERGLRVRQYAPEAGSSVACTVGPDDDFLISRLAADLRGAPRVDLSLCDDRGVEQVRMRDIPARPDGGGVILQESIDFARALPSTTLIARLVAVGETGEDRLLGEYTFNHTRTLPGSGGVAGVVSAP